MDAYPRNDTPNRRSFLLGAGAAGMCLAASPTGAGAAAGDASVDLPLTARALRSAQSTLRTGPIEGHRFSMVGLTWRGDVAAGALVRTRTQGIWSDWRALELLHDRPDHGTEGRGDLRATAPLWVGSSDAVDVRVPGGVRPGLSLALIDTGSGDSAWSARQSARETQPTTEAPKPPIQSRRSWRANEKWRDGGPTYNRTIQQVHIHHTATSNDYAASEVPAILRAIYRYHAKNLGWSDIGYNFLVDRFGTIWQGRAGGNGRPVRGAHTLGFNSTSVGVSVIGNFDTAKPSAAVIRSLVRLSAWKLDMYGRRPAGRAKVYSQGSDRYAAGQKVKLPVIDGHRDTNDTACPGGNVYAQLGAIRRRAQRRVDRYNEPDMVWEPA
ncbi:N-acetylmuramoyl-L-alanine amidase [Nocardioides sp.]|uniref:N-acetylmuramoyl-L-alanine amidase n=1 Tax=Nocardioides sp. TaxID=35761 RepID=UPI00356AD88B